MKRFALGLAISAAILVVRSAAGAAPQAVPAPGSPIHIERCLVVGRTELRDPFHGLPQQYVAGIAIRFVNVRAVPATLVRFGIRYEGSSESIIERGSFAQNVPADRMSASFAGSFIGANTVECSVLSANYSDGTAWNGEP